MHAVRSRLSAHRVRLAMLKIEQSIFSPVPSSCGPIMPQVDRLLIVVVDGHCCCVVCMYLKKHWHNNNSDVPTANGASYTKHTDSGALSVTWSARGCAAPATNAPVRFFGVFVCDIVVRLPTIFTRRRCQHPDRRRCRQARRPLLRQVVE